MIVWEKGERKSKRGENKPSQLEKGEGGEEGESIADGKSVIHILQKKEKRLMNIQWERCMRDVP